jgi:pimeloyl-ACP methyl ester carboxylesterase
MPHFIPNLHTLALPGCGHWVQQERATEVNEAMIAFLQGR